LYHSTTFLSERTKAKESEPFVGVSMDCKDAVLKKEPKVSFPKATRFPAARTE